MITQKRENGNHNRNNGTKKMVGPKQEQTWRDRDDTRVLEKEPLQETYFGMGQS